MGWEFKLGRPLPMEVAAAFIKSGLPSPDVSVGPRSAGAIPRRPMAFVALAKEALRLCGQSTPTVASKILAWNIQCTASPDKNPYRSATTLPSPDGCGHPGAETVPPTTAPRPTATAPHPRPPASFHPLPQLRLRNLRHRCQHLKQQCYRAIGSDQLRGGR